MKFSGENSEMVINKKILIANALWEINIFLEMNGQNVVDLNTTNGMSK